MLDSKRNLDFWGKLRRHEQKNTAFSPIAPQRIHFRGTKGIIRDCKYIDCFVLTCKFVSVEDAVRPF